MTDFIITVIIVVILGAAIIYIRKMKKSGKKCIGCPGGCSCSTGTEDDSPCSCGCQNK